MKQWQRIIAVCAAGMGLGLLAATPALAAKDVKDLVLKGDAKCTTCHDETDSPQLLAIATTRHGVKGDARTPTCTSCHGESVQHLGHKGSTKPPKPDLAFGKKTANSSEELSGACMTCHKGDNNNTHWTGSKHQSEDVTCASCHKVHTQTDKVRVKSAQAEVCFTCHKEQRADSKKISAHPLDKTGCSGCHNPHGSAGNKMVKKNTTNETCFTCHAEKRGPYLWEHQPVAEDCSSCHKPHGSNISPLLKTRSPFICSECHDGAHNSKAPYGTLTGGSQASPNSTVLPTENAGYRGCMNCHSMVHGSNHPAGALLQR